jgi:CHASE3 domain sensor protein
MREHTAKRSLALAIGLCGLVVLALASVVMSHDNESKSRESNVFRSTIAAFYHAVVSAEKSQRAYILTEDPDYRDDYYEAIKQIGEIRFTLTRLASTKAVTSADIDKLFRLTDERNSQLDSVIAAYDSLGFDAAVSTIRSNETKNTSSRIFLLIRTMVEQEGIALVEHQRRSDNLIQAALALMILTISCGLCVVYVAFMREIERRQQLVSSQKNLESLIDERATALSIERLRVEELLSELSGYQAHNLEIISRWLKSEHLTKGYTPMPAMKDNYGALDELEAEQNPSNQPSNRAA